MKFMLLMRHFLLVQQPKYCQLASWMVEVWVLAIEAH
jgi:hypothetical protein